jgi:RNA polymerase sigma-70 factor (ECF subfamily)
MDSTPEAELVSRCRRGEPQAWDELFDLHYAAAGRFVIQLASDFTREDVEEICQETFLAVIKNLNSFQGGSQLQTWLFRIAANKARDYRERQRAAKRGGGQTPLSLQAEDPETGLTLEPPSQAPGPDAGVLNAERIELLQLNVKTVSSRLSKCLDRLEEIARGVFSRENTTPFSV